MNAAATKKQVESVLSNRFGNIFERHERRTGGTLATGIAEIDELSQGLPRGAITEIHGTASSGRTSLLFSSLALATVQEETCALVDCSDTFDLSSATKAGINL